MAFCIIFSLVFGILLGVVPCIIMHKIKNGVELLYWERDKNFKFATVWLWFFSMIIITMCLFFTCIIYSYQDEEIDRLENRIEALEAYQEIDGTSHNNEISL